MNYIKHLRLLQINPSNFRVVLVNIGLKHVLIDMWANVKNEMIFLYFQP